MPKVRELQREEDGPQDSGIGSSPALTMQYDHLMRELEQAKQQNRWYASELALAQKAGYQTRSTESPVMDERAAEIFGDDDKPLIEALLKMKAELARVQQTIDEQSKNAAERIAEMEKQRDAAISEAVYAKTRLAGQGSPQAELGDTRSSTEQDRSNEMSRRLASSLNAQSELSRRIHSLIQDVESEKRAKELAEETAEAAQKRAQELDMHRQQHSSEMESLRAELHEAQTVARDASASHAELKSQHELLSIDKRDVDGRLETALSDTQNHSNILISLQEAVKASHERGQRLEQKLDEERQQRDQVEEKLRSLKAEHEERTAELENTSRQLRDAQEMADSHAEEARNHRGAVLAGLGKLADRGTDSSRSNDERVQVLEAQVENANSMVRQNQHAADVAAEKLRRAEERIAGLEAFQDQASREGLSIRKQLQAAMKENQSLLAHKAELEQHVQSQALEKNALAVQHASLRDILGERGINAAEVRRSRAMDSPSSLSRFSTPDLQRVRELEQQLESSLKSHDEMKAQFEEISERDEKMKKEYEEKLTALDNDHQAAVKYLRGTEKMLSKMKQELQRVKDENRELKKKLDKAKDESEASTRATPDDWEEERDRLKKELADAQANLKSSVEDLEGRLDTMQQQLQGAEDEIRQVRTAHATSQADLSTLQATHSQSRSDLDNLKRENTILEERARDAENKVQLLLDQVESSVDNYRRQSRMAGDAVPTMNGTLHHRPLSGLSEATNTPNHTQGHSRSHSDGNQSIISDTAGTNGRNSMALDSFAAELDALRSHWETTQNYRLSDRFDFERTPTSSAHPNTQSGDFGASLAQWRQGLSSDEDDETSRPTTSDGSTVRGEEGDDMGMAVTTPTQSKMK
jgi:chromosome segregation ATPase